MQHFCARRKKKFLGKGGGLSEESGFVLEVKQLTPTPSTWIDPENLIFLPFFYLTIGDRRSKSGGFGHRRGGILEQWCHSVVAQGPVKANLTGSEAVCTHPSLVVARHDPPATPTSRPETPATQCREVREHNTRWIGPVRVSVRTCDGRHSG